MTNELTVRWLLAQVGTAEVKVNLPMPITFDGREVGTLTQTEVTDGKLYGVGVVTDDDLIAKIRGGSQPIGFTAFSP
jgi:hypothetical protein